jgi:hypothetical protein
MRGGSTSAGREAVCLLVAALWLSALAFPSQAQFFDQFIVRPPADVPNAPSANTHNPPAGGGSAPSVPRGPALQSVPPAASAPQSAPAGQAVLAASAKFGRDLPTIPSGLYWRVYSAKPGQGALHPVKEDKSAAPSFVLPPGSYVVHVAFGLASAIKTVHLRAGEPAREIFELAAGGLKLEGKVGDVRIPAGQITFDLYKGSQFEPGDKRPIVHGVQSGDVILVSEGTYHVVSNYGDANSLVRSDIRVQSGKLTEATVTHRAAIITLKLVGQSGGEARANTQWTVLTPGGDVIKEAGGAFPRVILAEGEYRVIARNEDKSYERTLRVVTGVDVEVEVLAR